MKVSSSKYIQLSRLCLWRNLLFFAVTAFYACREKQPAGITVLWDEQKAKGIHISASLLEEKNIDSAKKYLIVKLAGSATGILGDYHTDDGIVFEPLLPFAAASNYEIWYRNKRIQTFSIPKDETGSPELVAIYPQQDTLPVNVLKLYFEFSKPMRESVSNQYIRLIRNETDTLQDVFLNLQPELWNENRTVLTIWFDPGRIKRDLQPNQRMGAPLEEGTRYRIFVSGQWKDARGNILNKDVTANFVAGKRDSLSPDPSAWIIQPPKPGTADPLQVNVLEPLDHFLLEESVQVADANGNIIKGRIVTEKKDKSLHFIPSLNWKPGEYQLFIDAKLEDLAGNNLNKPFDRDVTKTKLKEEAIYKKIFRIN